MPQPETVSDGGSGAASGPLAGIVVVELGHIVAGPTASLVLADLGAEVIKVERPGSGDQARHNKANQGHFVSYNSNKKSVGLDLASDGGKETLRRLLERADVLIDNFAPGALERLGFDKDAIAAINPRLVHCAIKGFLPGPLGGLPLTDEPAQMMGGLAYMTGPRGRPLRAGTSVVDITGALFAVIAALAALRERDVTGAGRSVHVGLYEAVVFLVGQHVAKAAMSGEVPEPLPERGMGRHLGWAIYRTFATRDGSDVFVGVLSDGHWENFCRTFALDDLWQDETLRTNAGRAAQHERLAERTAALIAELDRDDALRRLRDGGVPVAPVNTPRDLLEEPHLKALGFLKPVRSPEGVDAVVADLPIRSAGWLPAERRDPPSLGADTETVLRWLDQ